MTTAIIGTGQIGSAVARLLAAGGETVRLSSANAESAKDVAARIGTRATAWTTNRDAVEGADTVVLALWLDAIRAVIDDLADLLPGKLVIETSNPIAISAQGDVTRTLPEGQSSGQLVAEWLPAGVLFAKAFGTVGVELLESSARRQPDLAVLFYATDDAAAGTKVENLIRIAGFEPVRAGGISSSGRIEMGGDLHTFGGLQGRVLDRREALGLVTSGATA
jgi:predicted dinucleotide-binding enzyme